MFEYLPGPVFPDLEVITKSEGRKYQLPSGIWVPSITTVLGYFKQDSLNSWRNKIGHDNANDIADTAARRGTRLHNLCEAYLGNTPINFRSMMPDDIELFRSIRPELDRISRIRYVETPLYSTDLKVAGRNDCIADFDGVLSIIDFKTTRAEKEESWITSYFEQETAYSLMFEEMTGIVINQIVTIMVGEGNPQVFVKTRTPYVESLKTKLSTYHKEFPC